MLLNRRFLFTVAFFIVPFGAMAQTVTVQDLMPLAVGQYVQYNQYDTTTAGAAPTKNYSYYEALQSGLSFQGATGVSVVRDTLGAGNPSGAHDLHYSFTSAGDLQVFADTALLADILPSSLTAGITKPSNRWVDRYKMSTGTNAVYQIDTINTTYTSSGQTATVTITLSGKYDGMESVTVSGISYPTAYRFEFIANIAITDLGIPLGTLTLTESDWLVKGIGIVKTSLPLDSTKLAIVGTVVSAGGRDKEMTAYGVAGAASVSAPQTSSPGIRIYPNPASDEATISFNHPAKTILLYNPAGQMVRSFDIATHTGAALIWVQDMPNGMYLARVKFADGSSQSSEMVIQH